MTNKEYGSDFHICIEPEFLQNNGLNIFSNNDSYSLFFSGRVALYSLLEFGINEYGWKNVYFPGYYCHEVVDFIAALDIDISYYDFNPFEDNIRKELGIQDVERNVIINTSYFGIKKLNLSKYEKAIIVDDLTHDILTNPTGNYSFGSLRKQLPIPCGGFVRSEKKGTLPSRQSNLTATEAAMQKFTAMYLKKEYLAGRLESKSVYREQFLRSEEKFSERYTVAGMPSFVEILLNSLNIENILSVKRQNLEVAYSHLERGNKVVYNFGSDTDNALGLTLQLSSNMERNRLKKYLIERNIYPAILWPHQMTNRDIYYENTSLFIHLDFRYNTNDILFIVNTLNSFFN